MSSRATQAPRVSTLAHRPGGVRRRLRTWAMLGVMLGSVSLATDARAQTDDEEIGADGNETSAEAADPAAADQGAAEELETLLQKLLADGGTPTARLAAAREIASLNESSVPAIKAKLKQLRRNPTGGVAAVFKILREQSSSINGDNYDLLDALCKFSKDGGPGWKTSLAVTALFAALEHVGSTPAVRELVRFVDAHDGAWRVEITRRIRRLGEAAIPALIEGRRMSTDTRRYANRELDAMGKKTAGDMVQVKSAQTMGDVLQAFGNNHDIDALSVVLSFVNSDRALVRQAAREALGRYGQNGKWKLREAYTTLTGQNAQEGWSAEEIGRELFAAYDRVRLEEVHAVLEQGLAKVKAGKLEEGIAEFDRALAMQPVFERRREMIAPYTQWAEQWVESDPARALEVYRKVLRLDPEPDRKAKLGAMASYLEGRVLEKRGIADTEPFRRAVALDPSHTQASEELERLTEVHESTREKVRRYAAGGAVLAVAIAGIILFPRRWRRQD